ncbi:MAG TPA: 16S rRNA (guanine(966)-N(2))-methyltransferase RsmD [Planctomycetes bacterium]|nr:16S rRNA (guanine(966)-N(2))-methyltransferase RsmD [Planctomycetota bacterium]HIK59772.1 16S rRNA (guanine(966)-N(2))-methyltransferase RsmD [Planctomycetota bacterium]
MRIIAGEFRGRRLVGPPDRDTRPMLDRVREALFSTLGDRVEGARVLDLFAGTGSLGLEALSRGAKEARFVERDRRALERLADNVQTLDLRDRVRTTRGDALSPSNWSLGEAESGVRPDLVFMDPPYPLIRTRKGRASLIAALDLLLNGATAPGATLVLHTHPRDLRGTELITLCHGHTPEPRVYGNTALWYLQAGHDAEAD